ncbi:MAG: intA [Gammaproteobacteria bacterium]|jgi:integrase|nr:intA [Gammaproteobacteria bacterium]
MPLNDLLIRTAKPLEKAYKLSDQNGLFLLINPNGSKYWRLKYYFAGKEKLLALGVYPEVKLAEARDKRDQARKLLTENIDPVAAKRASKHAAIIASENAFETIAREWYQTLLPSWTASHAKKVMSRLEHDVFPWLGKQAIENITAPELLSVLRRIEQRGAIEPAHRILQNCSKIFRYAIATGRAQRDIAADLKGALKTYKNRHLPTIIDPKKIGKLLRAINDYQGYFITKCALKLAPLLFVRPGELRKAEWLEFNFETAEWRIPAEKMKMREMHIVPLAKQAIAILEELKPLTGNGKYLFPGIRYPNRPMSENTVNCALRRLGYTNDEITGHGFRSMASTLLNEQGWNRDAIERQLAHGERDKVRATYNFAEYLPERRKMMQHWGDYLEKLYNTSNTYS